MSTRVWSAYVYKGFIKENSVESFELSWVKLFSGISDETVRKRLLPISKLDNRIYKIVKHNSVWGSDISIKDCYKPSMAGKFHFYKEGKLLILPNNIVEDSDALGTYKNIVAHFFNKLNTDEPTYRIITPIRYKDAENIEEYVFGIDKEHYGTFSNYASDIIEMRDRFFASSGILFTFYKDGIGKYYKGSKELERDDYINIFKDEYANAINNKLRLKAPDYSYNSSNTSNLHYSRYPKIEEIFQKADLVGLFSFNINFINLIRETIKANETEMPSKSLEVLKEYLADLESCLPDLQDHANYIKIVNNLS